LTPGTPITSPKQLTCRPGGTKIDKHKKLGLVKKLGLDRRQASFVFGSSEDKAGKEAKYRPIGW
jgi:hypothetical protein